MTSKPGFAALCLGLALVTSAASAAPLGSREFNKLKKDALRAVATRQYGSLRSVLGELAQDDSERALELMSQLVVAAPEVFEAAVEAAASMSSDEVKDELLKQLDRSSSKPWEKIFFVEVQGLVTVTTHFDTPGGNCELYLRDKYGAQMAREVQSNNQYVQLVRRVVEPTRLFVWVNSSSKKCSTMYSIEAKVDPD